MTKYVCGFYFDHTLDRVVLIWKNKPKWQAGKLNGVGGKVEPLETHHEAMRREFREETGIDHPEWNILIRLGGDDWLVDFYCAIGRVDDFEYAETKEEEEVAKIYVDRLDDFDYVPNLQWLVPMAVHKLKYPKERMSI